MKLSDQIKQEVDPLLMLKHPFYQAWLEGRLPIETLRHYAAEYKNFVDHFPRFVSRIHSQCADASARKILITNLLEEEGYPDHSNHPELWENFAEGIGTPSDIFNKGPQSVAAKQLTEVFWSKCNSSYEEGLAALFTYEHQIPEVAKAKIEGLKQRYNIDSADCLEFFEVHQQADEWHSEACAKLIDQTSQDKKELVRNSARDCAKALWNFLSSCEPVTCQTHA